MYQRFDLNEKDPYLAGYHFPCEDAERVVCLIHGIGEYAGRFQRMADYFNRAHISVISMDLRGHGRSEEKRGHCAPREEVLKDVDKLITYGKEQYPGLPVILYGHSMGGNIGLDYRARGTYNGQLAGYVISAPWLRLVRPVPKPLYRAVRLLSQIAPRMTIGSACKEADLGNPQFVRPYKEDPLVHSQISMLCAYEGFTIGQALEQGSHPDNGRALKIPCLLMHGSEDKICDVEGSRHFAAHQDSHYFIYREWPGYYHEIHNGGPHGQTGEEVIRSAIDFIKNL